MSYSKDEKDWLGRDRTGHYDDKGNKTGISKDEKDWLGNDRTVHYDDKGNKTGISKDEKDWLGNDRTVHYDDKGNKVGISKTEKDWTGKEILQHYDKRGNKTGVSEYQKDWLGRSVLRHKSSSDSGSSAIAVIVIFLLIVVVILGTFAFPYKLVDSTISPFKLDWLEDKNVWIFCISSWVLIISSYSIIKLLLSKNTDKNIAEIISSGNIYINLLFLFSLPISLTYILKGQLSNNFILISGIILSAITVLLFLIFWKIKNAIPILLCYVMSGSVSIYILNNNNLRSYSNINLPAVNQDAEINLVTTKLEETSTSDYLSLDENGANNIFQRFYDGILTENINEIDPLLSERLNKYMSLTNVSKQDVLNDKRKYLSKWKLNEVNILGFKNIEQKIYQYKILIGVNNKTETSDVKYFLISGVIEFDNRNQINAMIDKETIGLFASNFINTESLSEIAGSSWVMYRENNLTPYLINFGHDGNFMLNLNSQENYKWNIQEEKLIFNVGDYSKTTCSLNNGILNCVGENQNSEKWNIVGQRKD